MCITHSGTCQGEQLTPQGREFRGVQLALSLSLVTASLMSPVASNFCQMLCTVPTELLAMSLSNSLPHNPPA